MTVFRVVPDGDLVLTNITYGPGNDIVMDVVAVPPDATSLFPGYQSDPVTGATIATGTLGPLPVGQYAVTTTFRVYDPVTGFTSPCPGEMISMLVVYAGDGLSPVIEYYNSNLDHYFITQYPVEIAALDAGAFSGWVRTGQSFLAYLPNQGLGTSRSCDTTACRAQGWIHTSTLSTAAKSSTLDPFFQSWKLETPDAFDLDFPVEDLSSRRLGTCPPADIPVYRLWNGRTDSDHRYMTDPRSRRR